MNERKLDRRFVGATIDIEICKKVERKYRLTENDSLSTIYSRALEDATRDVLLTADDYEAIAREVRENRAKRDAKRGKKTHV